MQKIIFSLTFSALLSTILTLTACKNNNFQPTDLQKYGVPMTVMAPTGVEVKSEEMAGGMNNVTLQKDKFDVQIIGLQSGAASAQSFLAEKKSELQLSDPTFKIITDDEDGMVY